MGMSFKEWKAYKLGDIVEDIAMGPFGSNIKTDNFISSGVPVIRGSNLNEAGLEGKHFVYISELKANSLKRSLAYPDDLVFTHRGTLGQVGIIPHGKYPKYLVSQSQMKLTVNKKFLVPKFLYYFFKSKLGQYELLKNSSQVGVPAIASPTKSLKEIDIIIPAVSTQQKIASILCSLDDKIELNRKINQTLEAIAQTLFKEMCVPKGEELPEGWIIKPLDDVAAFLNGLALQKFPSTDDKHYLPVIKIREIKNGITPSSDKASYDVPSKYIIDNGDLLFSWSATLEVIFWCGGKGALNQHLFKVTSNNYPLWFCYMLINFHLDSFRRIASDKTTTMGHIQRSHLTEALCFIPNNLIEIDKVISPIIDQIKNNNYEIQTLIKFRDSLLPKLMKGEIKI